MTATAPPVDPALRCPQCGDEIAPGQDWCLQCGRGATTRVVKPRHWRIPLVVAALLAALAGVGVAVLFVALSGDDQRIVTSGELTTTITVTTPSPTAPAVPTTPGAATPTTPTTPTTPPTQGGGATPPTSTERSPTTGGDD